MEEEQTGCVEGRTVLTGATSSSSVEETHSAHLFPKDSLHHSEGWAESLLVYVSGAQVFSVKCPRSLVGCDEGASS